MNTVSQLPFPAEEMHGSSVIFSLFDHLERRRSGIGQIAVDELSSGKFRVLVTIENWEPMAEGERYPSGFRAHEFTLDQGLVNFIRPSEDGETRFECLLPSNLAKASSCC